MFLTTAHKGTIEQHFAALRQHVSVLREIGDVGANKRLEKGAGELSSELYGMAVARALYVAIECVTDVGNVLIDALVMRDASSYVDIIDILADERALPADYAKELVPIVSLRKLLAHDYLEVDYTELMDRTVRDADVLGRFEAHIQAYIDTL